MTDASPDPGRLVPLNPRGPRASLAIALLITVFVVIALVKPWGTQVSRPIPTGLPPDGAVTATPSLVPPVTPSPPLPGLVAEGFTIKAPPDASAAWTGLRWRQLAADDPVKLVTFALRWRGGFVAVGWDPGGAATLTPVWTSKDGAVWDLLPVNTPSTFWPGVMVVGMADVPKGLVALTELATHTCGGGRCEAVYSPPVNAWRSADGRAWIPNGFFHIGPPTTNTNAQLLLATGPVGLVAASTDPERRVATSADGMFWRALPDDALPKGFELNDLHGTGTGYVAGGVLAASATHWDATMLWSRDGRTWVRASMPPGSGSVVLPAGPRTTLSAVVSVVSGKDGLVAVGRDLAPPGAALWWQSSDGRTWRLLPTYQPLGPTKCTGHRCGSEPNGTIIGDGRRMVAVRGGADAAAWSSSDGLAWQRLLVSGDLPGADASRALLLPGGVLLSDGTTTWYGEAVVN